MNLYQWGRTDQISLNVALGKVAGQYPNTKEGELQALGKASQVSPNEWPVWYKLAHACHKTKRYAEGFRAANRCVDLKPKDVRSMFILALAYDDLANGIYNEQARKNMQAAMDGEVAKKTVESLAQTRGLGARLRPDAAARLTAFLTQALPDFAGVDKALAELGMTPDTAVAEAERWYERTLQMVDYLQRKEVISFIDNLRHKAGKDK